MGIVGICENRLSTFSGNLVAQPLQVVDSTNETFLPLKMETIEIRK
jgi:hypothetical protein